jgi:NarL family two-component system response regulator LiaR
MEEKIRLLIVDDHPLIRQGLRTVLATEPWLEIAGEAGDGQEAIEMARQVEPDVILMDLNMPRLDGIAAISQIKPDLPQTEILVLTSFSEKEHVFPAIKAGASGYVLKDIPTEELLEAIRDVHQGRSSLHPTIARRLMEEIVQPNEDLPTIEEPLTEREIDVLKLVAQGLTNREVAEQLVLSENTVSTHMRKILGKLHLANRTQAALYALRTGISKLE